MVLTIDPARRLASALGLDGLSDAVKVVPALPALSAAMLDTKSSYDDLMRRITTAEHADRILENPAYRAFSKTMSQSHAYVAMERLHYVTRKEREDDAPTYDLVVLDTPPTSSALDILDAPGRLARFLDERIVEWFLATEGPSARAVKLLGRALGSSTVEEIVKFFQALADLREGFASRAQETIALLREETTAFVLVTAPRTTTLAAAKTLHEELSSREINVDAIFFNRAFVPEPGTFLPVHAPEEGGDELAAALRTVRAEVYGQNAHAIGEMKKFVTRASSQNGAWLLPERDADVRDVDELKGLMGSVVPLTAV